MKAFFHTFFYTPIYNLVVLFAAYVPGGDIGVAVILSTITVKIVLLPLSLSAVRTQKAMKRVEGHIKRIQEEHKGDREKLARETLSLYKEHGIRPFSSIFTMLIQIPFIISLYFVFLHQSLPTVDASLLYSFIHISDLHTSLHFLGLIDISGKSIILALIAALAQYWMSVYTIPATPKTDSPTKQEEFARAMSVQMRYVLPLIIGFVAFTSGAVALYFITSSLFSVGQEYYVRKRYGHL